ncbi:MAG: Nif3-like dinuclear metal center hexameric protein [Desulfobacteraceae bacterium]|nr:Nif3-like dinuclear metal center hexameric protein [Desulfobacteraceae bacterium]
MSVTVGDIIKIMETFAPSRLAEEWDNAGLQVGQKDQPVHTIWVAMDPLPDVVAEACKNNDNLLITHHPLIFKPFKSLDFNTPAGSVIRMAVRHNLSIFSAHTNLDSATGGVNDLLARRIGLKNPEVLGKSIVSDSYKLVVYVPAEYEQKVLDAIFETRAGIIGEYTCCSFRNKGKGTYRPSALAKPFSGVSGEISHAEELRIEVVVSEDDITDVIEHIRKNHPYETMAYDVYKIQNPKSEIQNPNQGLGRIGELDETMELASFALKIKDTLGLNSVKIAGKPDLPVNKAALCSGSGSGMMRNFMSSGAQVYISGDLRYHDARDAEAANLGLIDIGHFASEHLIVESLTERLRTALFEIGMDITVKACGLEKDPFKIL